MEAKAKIEKITGMEKLQEGAKEFTKLIYSMKDQIKDPDKTIIFISGMVGFSCQAAMMEKKQNYNLVKTTNGKHYIFGDALNYYLIESKISFYNILMGQYTFKIPGAEPIKIKPVLTRVASSIGLDSYLIGNKFHPEKVFDFDLYRSTWKKFYDTLIKYCSNSDEWPVLFSISLT